MTTNCIKFTSADIETAKGVGSISTLTFDLDITVEPVASANPMAPTHRVLGRSPRGKLVECGGIWKKQNKETGADYYTLTIRDHGFNANLGKAANQDDLSLQAVIPWGPKTPPKPTARPLRRSGFFSFKETTMVRVRNPCLKVAAYSGRRRRGG